MFRGNGATNYILLLIIAVSFSQLTFYVSTPSALRPTSAFKPDEWAAATEPSASSWNETVNLRDWRVPVPAPGGTE